MGTAVKVGIAIAILVVLAIFFVRSRGDISGADARKLVSSGGARLVDVRSREEFSEGHIAGAANIPLQEIGSRLSELEPKDQPVVLYCRSGNRSAQAASILKDAGFSAVHNMGAMSSW